MSIDTIDKWPHSLKRFVLVYLIISSIGMLTGLAFIRNETGVNPTGVTTHLKGNAEEAIEPGEIKFEKTVKDLLLTTHNHILGLSGIFFISGMLFYFTGYFSEGWRLFLMSEPLLALLTTFGGFWLIRFVPGFEWFVYVVMVSGMAMFAAWGLITFLTIRSLVKKG